MTNPLLDRTESATVLGRMATDDIAAAMLADAPDPTIAGATARFVPPAEPLTRAELEAAAEATDRAIAILETRLQAVAEDIERLPRSIPQTAETGTRVDFQG